MILLLTLVVIFHFAIITGLIPYQIVWAGKLNSVDEMYAFETVSIAINIFIIAFEGKAHKTKYFKQNIRCFFMVVCDTVCCQYRWKLNG